MRDIQEDLDEGVQAGLLGGRDIRAEPGTLAQL